MLRRKNIYILIIAVLLILISLSGCTGVKTANLEISFDPNPVYCENNELHWRVIISETSGVGVNLKTIVQDVYVGDDYIGNFHTSNEAEIEEWWGTSYLSAFSSMDFNAGMGTCEGNTGITIKCKVTGIDDNGNPIEATGRVDLLPE
jgi:hypothetical protein